MNSRAAVHSGAGWDHIVPGTIWATWEARLATLAATLLPVSLIWDYSWESTIGVDLIWSPPHLATHVAVWLGALVALQNLARCTRSKLPLGVGLRRLRASTGAWVMLWAVLAFEAAFVFDNWWQRAYGLGAGIWHPPQILKAASFLAMQCGVTLLCAARLGNRPGRGMLCAWNLGMMLALGGIMLGMLALPNAQHSATFYRIASAGFPLVLLIGTLASGRWGATVAASCYWLVAAAMVWLLPVFAATPQTGPIHNLLDHMLPPSFPLLLLIPAVGIDLIAGRFRAPSSWRSDLGLAVATGAGFTIMFLPAQWFFAKFLLSPAAKGWFFAGGGEHWPFFLKIDDARVRFWHTGPEALDETGILSCLLLAVVSARVGVCAGRGLNRLRR